VFINVCYRSNSTGSCTQTSSNGKAVYRVSVGIAWRKAAADSCASTRAGQCEYVATTLRDATTDPVFNRNISAPTITSYTTNPSPLHPGQQVQLTLGGTGFVAGATVSSDDAADVLGAPTSNTGNSLTVSYTATTYTGGKTIRVTNPDGGNASTSVTVTTSAPTLTALSPSNVNAGTTVAFTLTGTDFFASTLPAPTRPTVTVAGFGPSGAAALTATNVVVTSPTQLTFSLAVPVGGSNGSRPVTVTVTNPDTGTASNVFSPTVTGAQSSPTLTALSPTAATAGTTTTFTLTGTQFATSGTVGISVAGFGASGAPAVSASSVTVTSATQLSFVLAIPTGGANGSRPVAVTLTNPDGGTGTASFPVTVTGATSAPTLGGLSPNSVTPGTTVTFTLAGTGFATPTGPGITVSGLGTSGAPVTATAVSGTSPTLLTFQLAVPSGGPGGNRAVTLTLTNPDGGTATAGYTLTLPVVNPTLTALSPLTVRQNATNNYTLTGTGLLVAPATRPTVTVTYTYGGSSAAPLTGTAVTVVSATSATFSVAVANYGVPVNAQVTMKVDIRNPDGGTATKTFIVTVN